ncbi:DUF1304 domain-containing protein [Liquorilactobacillus sicerae]|uniref:DUF1304 domain-containing protein n=1 Tax=Liquorilactobacillus sicerae TaxID=1416943 RepID=UPI002480CEF3|nr:DUF1304 domain-containing protein [Liquorilactobacillus sicerae]
MRIITDIFILLVAVEALLIMLMEVWGNDQQLAKAFDLELDYIKQPAARVAMSNQGVYNGFIGVGLLFARYLLPTNSQVTVCLLFTGFVVVAAIWGSVTAKNFKILFVQGIPALIATLLLLI